MGQAVAHLGCHFPLEIALLSKPGRITQSLLGANLDAMSEVQFEAWSQRNEYAFFRLLHAMSKALGYNFNIVELRRGAYSPMAHWSAERRQEDILNGLAHVLSGRRALPLDVRSFPGPDDATAEQQKKLGDRLLKALAADGALKIEVKNGKLTE